MRNMQNDFSGNLDVSPYCRGAISAPHDGCHDNTSVDVNKQTDRLLLHFYSLTLWYNLYFFASEYV